MLWERSIPLLLDDLQLLLPLFSGHVSHILQHIWGLTDSSQLWAQLCLLLVQLLLAINFFIHLQLLIVFGSAFRPSWLALHPLFPGLSGFGIKKEVYLKVEFFPPPPRPFRVSAQWKEKGRANQGSLGSRRKKGHAKEGFYLGVQV